MENKELIPHLFRTEYRKIVSVLCRHFGLRQIAIAEDIASDTFLTATETWGLKGIPQNPVAWLYNAAKNKAKNHLQRDHFFENKIAPELKNNSSDSYPDDIDLSPQNISDSQLQMMFAICHPAIPPEAQIGLSLRILCSFSIEEIAAAFLTNKETINKRLFRAREKLRQQKNIISLPDPSEIDERLAPVLTTIYLLFNEGYYSVSQNKTLREELCLEAMRLCTMLVENKSTNQPQVNALLSLMCFHASRFEARLHENGELILYEEQDISRWNADLIGKGGYFLHCSANGNIISKYHIEAAIAYWHTQPSDENEKWENILQLYNRLLQIAYSPIAILNKMYALSKVNGKQAAITAAEELSLTDNHFYFALLGLLYTDIDHEKAKTNYRKAFSLAKTASQKQAIQKKMAIL
ncbi:sigma-70 family RNA polymerase sigma factor [Chitinophaga sp. MM2321]|uniref:RNA polymerase sigma factor n=1 Tax=Chitinophaga sp. MM2321 TaxID=3137178 RepID=UPI0032D56D73